MEKAYAKVYGAYDKIEGGLTGNALRVIFFFIISVLFVTNFQLFILVYFNSNIYVKIKLHIRNKNKKLKKNILMVFLDFKYKP
jgi:hypothetical protein